MTPYWLLFLLVMLAAIAPRRLKKPQGTVVWYVTGLAIAVMLGFRHQVGGDWFNYLRQFDSVASMTFLGAVQDTKDPAYYPLGWLIARLGGSVYWLNFACALLLSAGTLSLARRQVRPWLALLAAVPYLLIVVGMGYSRQAAAIGCAMLGLVALGDGKTRRFVFFVIVGAAFHKSAALLLPIAALSATRNRVWTFFWVMVMAVLSYWLFVHDSADTLVANYIESDYADASQGAGIRVAMNVVPALLLLLFRQKLCPILAERRLWTMMALGAMACVVLLPVSATAVDRVALYFIPLQVYVFGRITSIGSTSSSRTLLVLGVICYYAAVQAVWLNFASHADAWLPYQFMPIHLW